MIFYDLHARVVFTVNADYHSLCVTYFALLFAEAIEEQSLPFLGVGLAGFHVLMVVCPVVVGADRTGLSEVDVDIRTLWSENGVRALELFVYVLA